MSDSRELARRADETQQGALGGMPTAAGMMGVVQGMMGTLSGQPGAPTLVPSVPGQQIQSATMTSGGGNNTTDVRVGAGPDANTSQSYDPATNTLITTTVDPITGTTTTTMTSSHTSGGGNAMASSRATAGTASGRDPPQTARVTEVDDDDDDEEDEDEDEGF